MKLPKTMSANKWLMLNSDYYLYLSTPPLGQDMTQGQFVKRGLTGLNSDISFS